ncbi:putative B3 domain-containing protein, partial [Mucuna pruriens]
MDGAIDKEDVYEYLKWSHPENIMFMVALSRYPDDGDENGWKNVATKLPHRSPEELAQHHKALLRFEKHLDEFEEQFIREWNAEQPNVNAYEDTEMMQQSQDEDEVWKIKKVLQDYDLNKRLLVTMPMARKFVVPVLGNSDKEIEKGIVVPIWDVDTKTQHSLLFQKWSRSYVFTGNWTRDFVMRRSLKRKDVVGLCWDPSYNRFNFSLLRKDI